LFDEKTDAQASKESDKKWEHTIRAALNENRFRLVFQPIVNLHSKPAENYEILLRMLDEDNKEILPGEFMSAAEHSGLMPELDRWVVNNALTELADRRGAGKDTTFFIKLSGMTLNDKGFPPWLSKQLNSIKLPGDSIVFEISESLAIRYPTQIKKFINWLKVLHCRSALDHFGTHPQSLDLMKELSADYLKIDRSFMHNLSGNKENKDKVKSIVGTAHALNKLTIAEFVQDANCLSVLWQCGVDYIQGYFLQRPDTAMMYEFSEF
jgi:EAL domain-containing protein (putative c-di-GMP-specific phosphodiesterase class I)